MRSDYYQSLASYPYLNDIRQMIQQQGDAQVILDTVRNGIDRKLFKSNDYIQHPYHKQDCWVPLVYAFTLFDQYNETVRYLLKMGADPRMQPDVDADAMEPIIFTCHSLYLAHMLELGCNVKKYDRNVLENNMLKRLRTAEWRRLDILHRKGLIDIKSLIAGYKEDLIFYCLKNMKEYLMYCYNIRKNQIDKTEETNKVIQKFVETVKYLFKWGHPPSVNAIEFSVRFYMYEFLKLEQFKILKKQVLFHEDMDPVIVATYRPLLNDGRYTATCKVLGQSPDKRLHSK